MRILFVSASPINKNLSVGNTFLNLFEDMENVELASICTRDGKVDKRISQTFCITEKNIIKNLIKGTPIGKKIESSAENQDENVTVNGIPSNKIFRFIKTTRFTFFFWAQNLVWRIGKWKSKELEDFINEYNPDVIFTVLSNLSYLNKLVLHIKKISNKPLALYAWDNNYSLKQFILSPFRWISYFDSRRNMRKVAASADKFYVISDVQKADYEKAFKKSCTVLTKGADFDEPSEVKNNYNKPLQLIFTGNIGMNRWKSLSVIAESLREINKNDVKAELRIYTGSVVTENMKKALNIKNVSEIMGSVPASEIKKIQSDADILVHVEGLDLKNRLAVRQSFSTKIIDYFKSARPILAVGPKFVASIDHLVKNDCAIVADNKDELKEKLLFYIENTDKINQLVENAYECGKKYHNKSKIEQMLKQDLQIR